MLPSYEGDYEDRMNNRRHQKRGGNIATNAAFNILCQPSSFGQRDWRKETSPNHRRAPPINGYGNRPPVNTRIRDPFTNNSEDVARQLEELREDNKARSNRSNITFGAEGSDPFLYRKKGRNPSGGGTSRRTTREPISRADVKAKNMTSRIHFGEVKRDPMPGMSAQVPRCQQSRTAPADMSSLGMADIRMRKQNLQAQADKLQSDLRKKTLGDRNRIKERNGDSHFSLAVAPADLFTKQNNQLSSPVLAKIDFNARSEGQENTRTNNRSQIHNLEFGKKGGVKHPDYISKRQLPEGDLTEAEWDRLILLQQKRQYKLDMELQAMESKASKNGSGSNGL